MFVDDLEKLLKPVEDLKCAEEVFGDGSKANDGQD